MSFFTCRWLLPQKLQRSCSFPSLARAIDSPSTSIARVRLGRSPVAVCDDHVDDAVILGLLRGHEVVAVGVTTDLLEILAGVVGEDLLEPALQAERLAGADLDVRRLPAHPARRPDLVDEDLRVRQR